MNEGIQRLIKLFNGGVEFLSISILVAAAVILSTDGWKKGKAFFFAAVITGTVSGYVAEQTELLKGWSYLLAVAGTITGPATLAVFRQKTIVDLIDTVKTKINKNNP